MVGRLRGDSTKQPDFMVRYVILITSNGRLMMPDPLILHLVLLIVLTISEDIDSSKSSN